jgi:histo-blood group ABO system transferase
VSDEPVLQPKIALCVIATGKYGGFVKPLWESAQRYFLPDNEVRLFLFADAQQDIDCDFHPIAHRPWPGSTLYRYHAMLDAAQQFHDYDFVFYCDADMRFVAPVGGEMLGDLVAVTHPGYAGVPRRRLPYEGRPESRARVPPGAGTCYYAGAFQGGRTPSYLAAMSELRGAIDDDLRRGITAVWHDESHWNRYLVDHPADVVLPPSYCCPESWRMSGRRILALDKDHAELRKA